MLSCDWLNIPAVPCFRPLPLSQSKTKQEKVFAKATWHASAISPSQQTFTASIHRRLLLPLIQVAVLGEKHVSDGAEVLLCFVVAELHEDQLFLSDFRRPADHHSFFLWWEKSASSLVLKPRDHNETSSQVGIKPKVRLSGANLPL